MERGKRPPTSANAARQTLVANVALAGLSFITGVTAARLLGPVGRGNLAAIQLWPSVLAVLAMLGMSDSLAYFSAKEPDRANVYLASSIQVALLSSIAFIGLGFVLLPQVLHHYPHTVVREARWYLILIPLYALVLLPSHALRGTSQFAWWNVLRVAPSVLWACVLAIGAITAHGTPGALSAGNLLALSLLGIPVAAIIFHSIPGPYRSRRTESKSLIRYGLPAAGAFLPQLLNLRLDQLVMATVLPSRDLGLYVVAVAWSSAVNPIPYAIGMVLLPKVAGAPSRQARTEILRRTVRVGAWSTFLTVVAVASVTSFAFRLLFSPSFRAAIPAALILVGAGGLFAFNFILGEGVRGLARPAISLYAELGGLAVTAATLAVFLRPLGIVGAALSSVAGYAAVTVFLLIYLTAEIPGLLANVLTFSSFTETIAVARSLLKSGFHV